MRGIGWTATAAAGAVLGALLVTGCGQDGPSGGQAGGPTASVQSKAKPSTGSGSEPGSASPATSAGAFGKKQAAADIAAATGVAGLNQAMATTEVPSRADAATEDGKRRADRLACETPWTTMEPLPDSRKAYEATVAALVQRGWKPGERRQDGKLTTTALTKQGWTLLAQRYDFSTGKEAELGMPDVVSFTATEQACEAPFAEAEKEAASKKGE
ncbi:hypothetical protein ACFXDJ_18265 [Streptomyces sp. NPDC059443]|uniref:hypothetical protein n=1 Tax=unclassified Streptomyces TaxID=2593676 RepID=UPI003675F374